MPLVELARDSRSRPPSPRTAIWLHFVKATARDNTGIYTALVGGEKSVQSNPRSRRLLPNLVPRWTADRVHRAIPRTFRSTPSLLWAGQNIVFIVDLTSWQPDLPGHLTANFWPFPKVQHRRSASFLDLSALARRLQHPSPNFAARRIARPGALVFPRRAPSRLCPFHRGGRSNDIFVIGSREARPRVSLSIIVPIMGPPTWTAERREIVFSSGRGVATGLWRVSAAGGTPRPVAGPSARQNGRRSPPKANGWSTSRWLPGSISGGST